MIPHAIDPARCAFVAFNQAGAGLSLAFVSLYNNDAQGRVFAVHDFGRGSVANQAIGFSIQKGQNGSNPVNAQPVISDQPQPPGQATGGNSAIETIVLKNGIQSLSFGWLHEFPIVVLPSGYRLTAWAGSVNQALEIGFFYQVLHRGDLAPQPQPAPQIVWPKQFTLSLETE